MQLYWMVSESLDHSDSIFPLPGLQVNTTRQSLVVAVVVLLSFKVVTGLELRFSYLQDKHFPTEPSPKPRIPLLSISCLIFMIQYW